MFRTRLASVSYLNALPLTWGLPRGPHQDLVRITMAPPFECARLLQEGLVDVALIPSIEFARNAGLRPVPGTGIASRHEVRSVLLISRVAPTDIRSLAVDLNSRTSVALSRLVLAHRYRCLPRMVPMAPALGPMLESHDAALLIGDAALKASLETRANRLVTLDLAREWHDLVGLPFVFAIWACRPVVDVDAMKEMLAGSLEEGLRNIEEIARMETERTGLPRDLIASYLRDNIQYRLGPAESNSLRVFYRMCREAGLLSGQAAADLVIGQAEGSAPRAAPRPGTTDGNGTTSERRPRPPRDR